jgi:hypothetical protein
LSLKVVHIVVNEEVLDDLGTFSFLCLILTLALSKINPIVSTQ